MNRTLLLHFLKFDISSTNLDLGRAVDALYTSNDLRADFRAPHPSLSLELECVDTPATRPQPAPDAVFAETNLCGSRCYYRDGRFSATAEGEFAHHLVYDVRTHSIVARLSTRYHAEPQLVISNILRPLLQSFLLPLYGLKVLHGAVLSGREQTLLLTGPGGAGKTTTALQLLADGYDLLSDDGPMFALQGGTAHALSSLDYVHLTPGTLALFPHLTSRVVGAIDRRNKYAVPLESLQHRDRWRRPHPVTHIVQLRRSDVQRPELRACDRTEAHRRLLHESMTVFRPLVFRTADLPVRAYSEFIFRVVASLIEHAQVYDLTFADRHLTEVPSLLRGLSA